MRHPRPLNIFRSPTATRSLAVGTRRRYGQTMRCGFAALVMIVAGAAWAEPVAQADISILDADTIKTQGKTYRLVGFDAPELARAKCAIERQLGAQAIARLQAIISKGDLDLKEVACSCAPGTRGTRLCNLGRLCGMLTAKGEDVGDDLVRAGLARPFKCGKYRCPRRPGWC